MTGTRGGMRRQTTCNEWRRIACAGAGCCSEHVGNRGKQKKRGNRQPDYSRCHSGTTSVLTLNAPPEQTKVSQINLLRYRAGSEQRIRNPTRTYCFFITIILRYGNITQIFLRLRRLRITVGDHPAARPKNARIYRGWNLTHKTLKAVQIQDIRHITLDKRSVARLQAAWAMTGP